MKEMNTGFSESEVRLLFSYFDQDHNDAINFEEFIQGVRDPLNERRRKLVSMAFDKLDKNGDGISSSSDTVTHNDLDGIFIYDINGVLGGNGNTNDTYRYATINGTQLALPTYGSSASLPSTYSFIASPGTTNGSSSNSDNTTYNDLLAIWDAYNQTGTSTFIPGVPSGWATGYYWASSPSTLGHANVNMGSGAVWNSPDSQYNYVAVQVL
jgi:hypothetical protein